VTHLCCYNSIVHGPVLIIFGRSVAKTANNRTMLYFVSYITGGAGCPSNTMWPGPRPTFVPSGILIHPAVGHNTWAEKWGLLSPLFWGGEWVRWVPISVAWAKAYLRTKWHLDPTGHLAITDMGRKLWGCALLGRWLLGPDLTQCGRGLPPCQVSS